MPDNTWFTPYKFPPDQCLSLGPSQGIVYRLSEQSVVKMPFQYPVNAALPIDETKEKIWMSLRSFATFRRENSFYNIIAEMPHPNIAQRLQCKQRSCIILKYLNPVEQVWTHQTMDMRCLWIQQLLDALEWLENLGYTHGDLKINNMGIDDHHQLRLFDFGSVIHRDEEGFHNQVLEDRFYLATCIHILASGVDPFAGANSAIGVRHIRRQLKEGQGIVHKAAGDFKEVIQAGWMGVAHSGTSFSQERKTVAEIVNRITKNRVRQPEDILPSLRSACEEIMMEEDDRWKDEDDYRAAWRAEGFQPPDDVWN